MSFIVVGFIFVLFGFFFFAVDLQVLVTSIIPDLEFVIVIHIWFYFIIFMKCDIYYI